MPRVPKRDNKCGQRNNYLASVPSYPLDKLG